MFQLNLNFWQTLITRVVIFFLVWGSVWAAVVTYNTFKEPRVEIREVQVEKLVYKQQATSIDELNQGDSVKWYNWNMCVSSIDEANIRLSNDKGMPPVQIRLRKEGGC